MPYHMRRSEKEITEWTAIEEIIRKGKYLTLSLARDNEPYGVALNYGYARDERALYFHCAPDGLKSEFIRRNNTACASIIEDNGYQLGLCEHKYRSVVMRGKIEIVQTDDAKIHGLEVMLDHLEDNPDIKKQTMPSEAELYKVAIWKMTIDECSGKQMINV
ncbi:flavin-nucleotide-binding protein [candidate division GN15 bacterium]|uniref:Flavin-nucleotide-binding protein n=1 Tax=candidate division GN15 bacterium TaxID=2072418 RepID=A0A855X6Y1_9BACT|nr:MAG: flavin-nucleotide-binding protein [candidate division GN15 bacterium]